MILEEVRTMDWHNYYYRVSGANRAFRAVLVFLGLVLLAFGLLILLLPWLLQFLIGGAFMLAGAAILGAAWRRRLPPRQPHEPGDEPNVIDEWR
jgi:hypothetical protein